MHRSEPKATVADHSRGYAVPAGDRAIRIPIDVGIVVRVEIGKGWRDNQAMHIERLASLMCTQPPDLDDASILNPKICLVAGNTCAVDEHAAVDDKIKLCHDNSSPFMCTVVRFSCRGFL